MTTQTKRTSARIRRIDYHTVELTIPANHPLADPINENPTIQTYHVPIGGGYVRDQHNKQICGELATRG